jgi:hypothetical protein
MVQPASGTMLDDLRLRSLKGSLETHPQIPRARRQTPSLVSRLYPAAGLQDVYRSIFEEIRGDQELHKRDLAWKAGHGMLTVPWECVWQVLPLLRLIKSAFKADKRWGQANGDVTTQGQRDLAIKLPVIKYLNHSVTRSGAPYIE